MLLQLHKKDGLYIQEKDGASFIAHPPCLGSGKPVLSERTINYNPILVLIFKGTVGAVPKMIKHQGRAYHTSIHHFYFCL